MSQIPEYIRPFYKILLDEYAELEKQLAKEGHANRVIASKQAAFNKTSSSCRFFISHCLFTYGIQFQDIARGYLKEAEWTNKGHVASFPEYMKNGSITSGLSVISKSALVGVGEIVSEDALAWYASYPKILQASELISRLQDDIMTYQVTISRRTYLCYGHYVF